MRLRRGLALSSSRPTSSPGRIAPATQTAGCSYVSVTVRGETRRIRATGEHGNNLDAARKFKRDLESARDRGEPIHAHAETERVLDYAARWLPSSHGWASASRADHSIR